MNKGVIVIETAAESEEPGRPGNRRVTIQFRTMVYLGGDITNFLSEPVHAETNEEGFRAYSENFNRHLRKIRQLLDGITELSWVLSVFSSALMIGILHMVLMKSWESLVKWAVSAGIAFILIFFRDQLLKMVIRLVIRRAMKVYFK